MSVLSREAGETLLAAAARSGYVTVDDVLGVLDPASGDEVLREALSELAVRGVDVLERKVTLYTSVGADRAVAPDATRAYRRELGRRPLLTREGEVALGRSIRRSNQAIHRALSRSASVCRYLVRLGGVALAGDRPFRQVFDPTAPMLVASLSRLGLQPLGGDGQPPPVLCAHLRLELASASAAIVRLEQVADAITRRERVWGVVHPPGRRLVASARVSMSRALRALPFEPLIWREAAIVLDRCHSAQRARASHAAVAASRRAAGLRRLALKPRPLPPCFSAADDVDLLFALCRRYQRAVVAGRKPRCRLMEANLRLVVTLASRSYRPGQGIMLNDLIQEGNFGLMRAVEKFDPGRGFKFSTYATWWIRQSVSRALLELGRTVRVPGHMQETLSTIRSAEGELFHQLGRPATLDELSAYTGRAADVLDRLARVPLAEHSLDEPVSVYDFDDGDTYEMRLPDASVPNPEQAAAELDRRSAIEAVITLVLDPREQIIIRRRFGFPDPAAPVRSPGSPLPTLEEEIGVSKERVRQIEVKALHKLGHPAVRARLAPYAQDLGGVAPPVADACSP